MADVITRFRLETTQYDSALRSAAQQLREYGSKAMAAGNEFQKFTKGQEEAARALGNIAVAANNPKDKVRELVAAFNDAAKAYNALSKEQQKSDWGKALAESIQTLKGRISEAKQELYSVKETSTETGNIIEQLASKFGISTKALMGWGAAIAAGKVALDTAKDTFFASEQNIDDWGRTVESSKMLYEGFLTALNTGDIGGYLQNMGNIAQAAMDAYNELDRLGTMKTINAPSTSGRQTEITRLQGMLRSGRAVDSLTGGKSYAEDGAVLTKAQKQQVADDLKALLKESRDTAQQEINQATSAINALYKEQATVLGMNTDEFRKGTKNMQEFDKVLEGAKKYREFEQQHTTKIQTTSGTVGATYTSSVRDNAVNPYEQFKAWRDFKDDGPMYQRLVQEIQKRDQATQQFYGLVNQSYRGINRAEGVRVGGTTTPQTDQEKAQALYDQAVKDYSQALEEAALAVESGQADTVAAKKKELSAAESLWKAIGDAREVYDSDAFKTAQEDAAKKVVELGGSVNALVEEQKKAQEAAREMAAAQKRVATALDEAAEAYKANDLKGYISAMKKVGGDASQGIATGNFTFTEGNIGAFTQSLKEQIAQSDLGSTLYNNLTAQLADANALANLMQVAIKNGIDVSQFNPQDLWKKVFSENPGDYISDKTWQSIQEAINAKLKEMKLDPINLNFKTGKAGNSMSDISSTDLDKVTSDLGKMTSGISSIASGIEQIGIELPSGVKDVVGVVQGISSILSGISSLVAAISTTSAISAIPGFAHGGVVPHAATGYVVPGTHYSGDVTPIMANAGEVVLNRAQVVNLASQLRGQEYSGGSSTPYVSGEYIILGANNHLRRTGQGEIVTTATLRRYGLI